jgi:hypothetical protein
LTKQKNGEQVQVLDFKEAIKIIREGTMTETKEAKNPFLPGQINLTEQGKLTRANPELARRYKAEVKYGGKAMLRMTYDSLPPEEKTEFILGGGIIADFPPLPKG